MSRRVLPLSKRVAYYIRNANVRHQSKKFYKSQRVFLFVMFIISDSAFNML